MELIDTIASENLPLSRKLIIALLIGSDLAHKSLSTTLKKHGISLQQFNVLRILKGRNGEPANLLTIQQRMVTKMSNTTRLVDKLILKKYVTRVLCPSNRRKVEISITDKGLQLLATIDPEFENTELQVVNNLTPNEAQQLNNLLIKLIKQ